MRLDGAISLKAVIFKSIKSLFHCEINDERDFVFQRLLIFEWASLTVFACRDREKLLKSSVRIDGL
jgi:hypothetical protein